MRAGTTRRTAGRNAVTTGAAAGGGSGGDSSAGYHRLLQTTSTRSVPSAVKCQSWRGSCPLCHRCSWAFVFCALVLYSAEISNILNFNLALTCRFKGGPYITFDYCLLSFTERHLNKKNIPVVEQIRVGSDLNTTNMKYPNMTGVKSNHVFILRSV